MSSLKSFDHLKIPLQDIKSATNNFDENYMIGRGGFGLVYKGELLLPEGPTVFAFKRLDRKMGQGDVEFWKEIMMLSEYRHKNLISLLYFCIEDGEMILVYEYAAGGSLDKYISDPSLTWIKRLKICVGVAHALNYLHDPRGKQQRLLHRDIKSSNILLDCEWTPKVSDFGLSKLGPANQQITYLISTLVGTPGYCDPLYWETGLLSKESDVYSFGVVLFEVMCGKLCFKYFGQDMSILVPQWRKCYDDKKLDEIVPRYLKEQLEPGSFYTFSTIAYQCIKRSNDERPKMAQIVEKLEFALKQQEVFEYLQEKADFEEIRRIANLAHVHAEYQGQLLIFFMKGVLVDAINTFISINNSGEFIELVSATTCFSGEELISESNENSRFSQALWGWPYRPLKVEVTTHFLSPNVHYTVNLVFRHCGMDQKIPMTFQYKLENETKYSTSCVTHLRKDGWLTTELFQFKSSQKQHDFSIEFLESVDIYSSCTLFFLEGIEFRPSE